MSIVYMSIDQDGMGSTYMIKLTIKRQARQNMFFW